MGSSMYVNSSWHEIMTSGYLPETIITVRHCLNRRMAVHKVI